MVTTFVCTKRRDEEYGRGRVGIGTPYSGSYHF
jgi:hypothetical protein